MKSSGEEISDDHFQKKAFFDDKHFELALKNSSIIIAYVDKELRYRWIYNPHSDFTSTQLIGKRDDEIIDSPGSKRLIALKQKVIDTEKSQSEIIGIELSNGKRYYNICAEPLYDSDGALQGVTTVAMDITEYEKMKERMMRTEKFSAVGKLAFGIAHEFNNILAIIMGNVQLLLKKNKDDQLKLEEDDENKLKVIIEKCNRAKEITHSMMTISGPEKAEKDFYDIGRLIEEVIFLFRKEFIQNNIEIVRRYEFESLLKVDKNQIKQVFINLFSNSIHAILPKNRGKINIHLNETDDEAIIIFSDTGIGMDKETKEKIFDPFFTTKGGYSKENIIDGTGLGLSVTYKYIQNHNGTISVRSVPEKGTSITIKFPKD